MRNKLFVAFIITLLFNSKGILAQEELGNLWSTSSTLLHPTEVKSLKSDHIDLGSENITYLYTMQNLPFIDDFSSFKIKQFVYDTNHASVFDSTSVTFTVNGSALDSFKYKTDTVYNYVVDPTNQQLDSSVAPRVRINFYLDSLKPFEITHIADVFPHFSTFTQNGMTRLIYHQEDSTLINRSVKRYFANDDSSSLWLSGGTRWSATLAVDPPTLGVAYFDGLDEFGLPYDNTDRNSYGLADQFISKPINLYSDPQSGKRYTSSDSVYLSFYVQPYGFGDRPEEMDSLILEFYSPTLDRWVHKWSAPGDSTYAFDKLYFHIADTHFLQYGFQFRFKNYATLSGSFDHWMLDYVQLDAERNRNDKIRDVAFVYPVHSLVKNYTSIPWTHYQDNPWNRTIPEIDMIVRNLGPDTDLGQSDYKMFLNSELNPFFRSKRTDISSVPSDGLQDVVHTVFNAPNSFTFPVDTLSRQYFKMTLRTFVTKDDYPENDTIRHFQIFDKYYSYDDGSAEKTYHLNLTGTTVAVRYKSVIMDTLRGISINFVETFEPPSNQKINLVVYKDLNSSPIYSSGPIDVIRNPAGKFHRYTIDPIVLEGDFYIGYQQLSTEKTYVGYDINHNNQGNTFLKEIGGSWNNSIFLGTMMLRADFGDGSDTPLSNKEKTMLYSDLKIYPNPSSGLFHFSQDISEEVNVYSLSGKQVFSSEITGNSIDLSHVDNGFYIMKVGEEKTIKIIVTH